jgi:hypothetical protein
MDLNPGLEIFVTCGILSYFIFIRNKMASITITDTKCLKNLRRRRNLNRILVC